ncbi:hypothetical protein T484DRAFT_2770332 [Baffinella frigidus]|nr:hypothetical protein T484DRAFT_2770332 [Cryptophyta sp. CCMP2293]
MLGLSSLAIRATAWLATITAASQFTCMSQLKFIEGWPYGMRGQNWMDAGAALRFPSLSAWQLRNLVPSAPRARCV